MSLPAGQFVINPDTGRLIQRGGATHRRWKRRHLDAPDLQPVPLHLLTPRLQQRVLDSSSTLSRPSTPVPALRQPPARRHSLPCRLHSFPQLNMSQPAMTRTIAGGYDDSESKVGNFAEKCVHPTAHEADADLMVDEVLARHGPQLLQAYENPQDDLVNMLAEAFGMEALPAKSP